MEEEQLLVPRDVYLKSGIHIGTKFKTKHMDKFIYKNRVDGLSVLNIQQIDERIAIAAKFLAQYEPEEILIASRRENGWKPVRVFSEVTGIKSYPGRYPPGLLTNPNQDNFIEAKILLVTDAWPDRNAVSDAIKAGIPVIALCDTNNQANNIDLVVPCNNKGKKSLGLLFWILAREYLKLTGKIKKVEDLKKTPEDFSEE
jgi:small subunit ribosomal protein S2